MAAMPRSTSLARLLRRPFAGLMALVLAWMSVWPMLAHAAQPGHAGPAWLCLNSARTDAAAMAWTASDQQRLTDWWADAPPELRSALLDTLPEPVKAQVSAAAHALCSLCATMPLAMAPPPAVPVWHPLPGCELQPQAFLQRPARHSVWLHAHSRAPPSHPRQSA